MVAVKYDTDGRVVAYVDYEIVDKDGHWCNNGDYCFVRYLFIHPSVKNKYTLKDFVMKEHMRFPSVKWLYYQRQEKGDDKMRCYPITRFYRNERKRGV